MAETRQWLRQSAASYEDRERVCADVEVVLGGFPALRPRSDVYTYDDGRAQLLLCIHGLLPISFRGSSYNIPIAIWLTKDYPRHPPIVYVVPTNDMLVRPSKHIDLSGRCTIQYIRDWHKKPEPCNIAALLQAMQALFSRLPPLYAKSKSSSPHPAPQPLPSPPSDSPSQPLSLAQSRHDDRPALPPKPIPSQRPTAAPLGYTQTDLYNRPPPPLPQQPRADIRPPQYHPSILPPQRLYSSDGNTVRSTIEQSRESSSPTSPNYRTSITPNALSSVPSPNPSSPSAHVPPPVPALPLSHSTQPQPQAPPQPVVQPVPRPNLLDDESPDPQPPSDRAPPRPPNPELLQLHAHVHDKIRSELSSLSQLILLEADRLRAQQADLLAGEPAIRDEMARLEAVRDVCRNVAARLRSTVEHVERNLADLRRKGDPEVDELVCSTSIVHNQQASLPPICPPVTAHPIRVQGLEHWPHRSRTFFEGERYSSIGHMFLISHSVAQTTRVLAEEQFMKRALIDKIQMGIPMGTNLPYA
ncbi:hypothetical protein J3R82DRAFT_5629 [Butyriboletus roseoflavus]|nr:hypothetical protein J3R82DRAFT_5629 [Butyriboletus roseoflavus]